MRFKQFYLLKERVYDRLIDPDGESFPVYLNPTVDEMRVMRTSLRGLIDKNGDFYVWPGHHMIHITVDKALDIRAKYHLVINFDSGYVIAAPGFPFALAEIRGNTNLIKAMGTDNFRLESY